MPDLGVPELLIIAAIILLLFGSKKLPDAARSLGRSLRIFKAETRGLHDDVETPQDPAHSQALGAPPATQSLPPAAPAPVTQPVQSPQSEAADQTRP